MATKRTKKQIARRSRYGMTKLKTGAKVAWISRQNKNGWSLGLALNSKTLWLSNLRLASIDEVKRALKAAPLFIHLADSDAKV